MLPRASAAILADRRSMAMWRISPTALTLLAVAAAPSGGLAGRLLPRMAPHARALSARQEEDSNHTIRVSFTASGAVGDYTEARKAKILGVITTVAGLDSIPSGATLLVTSARVDIEAIFTVADAAKSELAVSNLARLMGTPALATVVFTLAGLSDLTVATAPVVTALEAVDDHVAHLVTVSFDAVFGAPDYATFKKNRILEVIAAAAGLPTPGALVSVDSASDSGTRRIDFAFPVFGTTRSRTAAAAISVAMGDTPELATAFLAAGGVADVTAATAPVVRGDRATDGVHTIKVALTASGDVSDHHTQQRRAAILDAITAAAGLESTPQGAMLLITPGSVNIEAIFTVADAAQSDAAASSLVSLMGTPALATSVFAVAGLAGLTVETAPAVLQELSPPSAVHVVTVSFVAVGQVYDYSGEGVPGVDRSNASAVTRSREAAEARRAEVLEAIAMAAVRSYCRPRTRTHSCGLWPWPLLLLLLPCCPPPRPPHPPLARPTPTEHHPY